jgi:hypothetical protein
MALSSKAIYRRLEQARIQMALLQEVLRGLDDLEKGKTLSLAQLKSRHGC